MIRDGRLPGGNISILEAATRMGGSRYGAGDAVRSYSLRGGRMFTTDNYECTWDSLQIDSFTEQRRQVGIDEIVEFNERHKSHSLARLVIVEAKKHLDES